MTVKYSPGRAEFEATMRSRLKWLWPYTVDIGSDKQHYYKAVNWLAENCEGEYGTFPKHDGFCFKFKLEKDVTMFALMFARNEEN